MNSRRIFRKYNESMQSDYLKLAVLPHIFASRQRMHFYINKTKFYEAKWSAHTCRIKTMASWIIVIKTSTDYYYFKPVELRSIYIFSQI